MSTPIEQLWEDFLTKFEAVKTASQIIHAHPPIAIEAPTFRRNHQLRWQPYDELPPPPTHTVADVRAELPGVLRNFYATATPGKHLLLVTTGAGSGKTHTALEFVQQLAMQNLHSLWHSPRHNSFDDLCQFAHFYGKYWYHYRPMDYELVQGQPLCQHHKYQRVWQHKGYPSMRMCVSVCPTYHSRCPYRLQQHQSEPIWFMMHQHIVYGLPRRANHLAIVDEVPISAFMKKRMIPRDKLVIEGMKGATLRLFKQLSQLPSCQGKELLDSIGGLLPSVFTQMQHMMIEDVKQLVPWITDAKEAKKVPYWFLPDFLTLIYPEYECWDQEWSRWNSRIRLTDNHLVIQTRHEVWEHLPDKVVVLDATANAGLYDQLFPDYQIQQYNPPVKTQGRVFQITNRLNGVSEFTDSPERLTETASLVSALTTYHRYTGQIGIISHKKIIKGLLEHLQNQLPNDLLSGYFYNLRGSNEMQHCEAVFVVGAPSPDMRSLLSLALSLTTEMTPFDRVDEQSGKKRVLYSYTEQPYYFQDQAGQVPFRLVGGHWNHPLMHNLHWLSREAELHQAVHRARINFRQADVWLLTSIPTDVWLSGIYETPFNWQLEVEKTRGRGTRTLKMNWPHVIKLIQAGLPETISYQSLSELTGVEEQSIKNERWVDVIQAHLPGYLKGRKNGQYILQRFE